jgi:hypothetical protein
VSQVVSVAPDGPKVVSLVRIGYHWTNPRFVLTFDQPLAVGPAQNLANYRLTGPGGRAIPLIGAVLGSAGTTVTLFPKGYVSVFQPVVLTVNGVAPGGLTNTAGLFLDGAGNGTPGSDFVAPITVGNIVGPTPLPVAPRPSSHATHAVAHPAPKVHRPSVDPRGHVHPGHRPGNR